MNPLFKQMTSSPIQNILGSSNPMSMAMSMLQQKSPQAFKQIETLMASGTNPQQALKQLGIDPNQFQSMINNFSRQKY